MKKASIEDMLEKYLSLQHPNWVHKGDILLMEWRDENGNRYMSNSIDRDLRRAETKKKIAVDKSGVGRGSIYKWIPNKLREKYICTSQRVDGKLFRV